MKIQVLGSGCPTCKNLFELTKKALEELSINSEVEYLTGQEGIAAIVQMGVVTSPVLTINNKPVMVGFFPDIEKIKNLSKKP